MVRHVTKFHGGTLFNQKQQTRICQILNQFLTPLKQIVRKTPIPGGDCASKTWLFSSACENLGTQHPLRAEKLSSEKAF